jgi:hypothetical protein
VRTGNRIPTAASQRQKLKIMEGAPGKTILEVGRSVFADDMASRHHGQEVNRRAH